MIGWVNRPIGDLASAPLPLDIHWLKPRTMHRYLADPFGVPGAADRIYCEELDENDNRGRIKEITISAGRIQSEVNVDLGIPGHLSYPYLFRLGGKLYCLPESEATRRCQLFVHDAARGWRPFATILENVAAADPTIFQWEGRFWLAYTDSDQSPHDNLCLYYADDLSGPWSPHINNPVKIDVSSSRPAGTPFFSGSTLYRPAQDCSQTYGGAVALNRVIDCTPTRYIEETVRVLHPPSGINPHGLHTVSAWGERTLVDGKRHIVNPVVLLRKLRQRWPSRKMEFAKDVNETA
jgi:hypothetical protein